MKDFLKRHLPDYLVRFLVGLKNGNYYMFFLLFPAKKNKIVFTNYFGNGYGDNGKYIADEIIKQNLKYDIVWLIKKELYGKVNLPPKVRPVKYGSFWGLYELATSKIWIDNCRKGFFPPKKSSQYYIQTWHGGLGIKKIEGDTEAALSNHYIKTAKKDSEMADLLISNSMHLTNIYRRAFWYSGRILECGYPKNDIFFQDNSDIRKNVRDYYKLDDNTKIVLYAPTFRTNKSLAPYNINYSLLIKKMEERTNNNWVVLIRLHPNLIGYDNDIQYNDKIINATHYSDMQELVIGCDVLISDYSSCMFDSGMMKIPTFIYASDLEDYMKDRGSYFEFDELPFPVAVNNEELLNNIINFDQEKYEKDVDNFNDKVGLKDTGNAAKQIVDVILKVSKEK